MEESNRLDPSTRAVINTNFDTNNIVPMDESLPRIKTTLQKCQKILKNHCGPQSGYAMLVNNMSAGVNFEPNVFTRDGIRILQAVEFLSPLERYIKELLTYVGQRVDNVAKDGTTTSMLFSSYFLEAAVDRAHLVKDNNLSVFEVNKIVEKAFDDIVKALDKYTFNIEKINNTEEVDEEVKVKTAGLVAFMQALSSSGGNVELANAMKEIFEKSPSMAWDFITSHNSIKENGKPFSVEVAEYDTRLRCITGQEGILNAELGTEYIENNVKVIVSTIPVDDMGAKTDSLKKYLRESDPNTPIILISRMLAGTILTEIQDINLKRAKKIAYWQYSPEYKIAGLAYDYEILITAAIAGVIPFDMDEENDFIVEDKHVFTAEKVHFHDTYMEFYGVVKNATSNLHPMYAHPETATQFYADTRHTLEKQLELYKEGHKVDGKMGGLFTEMLNKIACIHRPQLRLGGPAHEQIANADVVQDVQGAIMSSLKHGFLINGPMAIRCAIHDVIESYEHDTSINSANTGTFIKTILKDMFDCISKITDYLVTENKCCNASEEMSDDAMQLFSDNPEIYLNVLDGKHRQFREFLSKVENNEDTENYGSTYPVLQPVTITTELLKRVRELLLKFILTNQIIVYGAVMVKEEE